MIDLSGILTSIAIIVSFGALIYTIWSSKSENRHSKNSKRISALEFKVNSIHNTLQSNGHIVDTIAGALHTLDNRQTVVNLVVLEDPKLKFFEDEEQKHFRNLQRRLTELGLFSKDKERRVSAQRSLAHDDGDFKSLQLMKKIEKGELGTRDNEIVQQILTLDSRLKRMIDSVENWPGRPSGGEF